MTWMQQGTRYLGAMALAAVLVLAGCGNDQDQLALTNLTKRLVSDIGREDREAAGQAAVLAVTRAQADASQLPLLRVRIEGTGALSTMAEIDRKGPHSTWIGPDGGAFLFRDGMLIGTRGLGQDLMGLTGPGLAAAVAAEEFTRVWRYLDGDEQLIDVPLRCLAERRPHEPIRILGRDHTVEQIAEYCQGLAADGKPIAIENFYWVTPGTTQVWQSRQFISRKFGRAEMEVLKQ